jgi:hypothetical protein
VAARGQQLGVGLCRPFDQQHEPITIVGIDEHHVEPADMLGDQFDKECEATIRHQPTAVGAFDLFQCVACLDDDDIGLQVIAEFLDRGRVAAEEDLRAA